MDSIRIWSQKERNELPHLYTSTIEAYLEEKEGCSELNSLKLLENHHCLRLQPPAELGLNPILLLLLHILSQ